MSADATAFLSGDSRGPGHVRIPAARYESMRLLSSIVSSSDDAIVSATINGQVTSWNGAAERLFGYSAQEMIGQSLMRLVTNSSDREPDWDCGVALTSSTGMEAGFCYAAARANNSTARCSC